MKSFLSHLLTGIIGALLVVFILFGIDQLSTIYPLYVPNIFYKSKVDYIVNIESAVSEAIEKTAGDVVQVNNYLGNTLRGSGSGVIYKLTNDKAYIVTNNHVVEGASKVEIETTSGYRVFGEIKGTDPMTDLAVIEIEKGTIDHCMSFADSHSLKVGEHVIAIGNPLGLSGSATLGILSSKERLVAVDTNKDEEVDWYASVLQTDAAINPGNSGGALINLDGKLIGINSMKIAESDVEGIGFSIPSNLVDRIILDLETNGEVKRPEKLLGIGFRNVIYENYIAIKINEVIDGSLADKSGLLTDDLIIEINGDRIKYYFDLKYYLSTSKVNEKISLTIVREDELIVKEIIITE